MPTPKGALDDQQQQRDAQHRRGQDLDDRRGVEGPQRNSGIRNQVIPGGRSLWMVTMKLMPVKIELKPRMKAPAVNATTLVFGDRAVGRVERPAGIDPAQDDRGEGEDRPDHVEVAAHEVQPREGDVLRPEHDRQHEVAQRGRNARG